MSELNPMVELPGAPPGVMEPVPHVPQGPWRTAWRRLLRNRAATLALVGLAIITILCVGGSILFHASQREQNLDQVLQGPSAQHWFGTDVLGRDVFQRVLCGGGVSLLIGLVATTVAMLIGTTYGLVSGLGSPRLDGIMMRIVDILYSFPFMALVILLAAVFGRSFLLLFGAIGAVEWLTTARVVRGQALGLKNQEFVLAARASGAGWSRIFWRHLVPNVIGHVVIYATLTVPGVMLIEAVLSFLGLGVPPPNSSWGVLIHEGAANMETSPWLLVFPGVFFVLTLLAINTLGDGLRDALDPKDTH
jgi:oligopeptide transport system permease protein